MLIGGPPCFPHTGPDAGAPHNRSPRSGASRTPSGPNQVSTTRPRHACSPAAGGSSGAVSRANA